MHDPASGKWHLDQSAYIFLAPINNEPDGIFFFAYSSSNASRSSFTTSRNLISAGTGICGGSAIAAIAPVIDADDSDIAYAMS